MSKNLLKDKVLSKKSLLIKKKIEKREINLKIVGKIFLKKLLLFLCRIRKSKKIIPLELMLINSLMIRLKNCF